MKYWKLVIDFTKIQKGGINVRVLIRHLKHLRVLV